MKKLITQSQASHEMNWNKPIPKLQDLSQESKGNSNIESFFYSLNSPGTHSQQNKNTAKGSELTSLSLFHQTGVTGSADIHCQYLSNCPLKKNSMKCIYEYDNCRTKKFYDKWGVNALEGFK